MIVNLFKIDVINKIFQRTLINEILIDNKAQISKNTLDYEIININKINCITKDH